MTRPPSAGRQPPESPVAGAARHEGDLLPLGQLDQGGDVLGALREDDEVGQRAEKGEPVGLVGQQFLGVGEHRPLAEEGFHLPAQGLLPRVGQRGHAPIIAPTEG
jgi:hypothetical protein